MRTTTEKMFHLFLSNGIKVQSNGGMIKAQQLMPYKTTKKWWLNFKCHKSKQFYVAAPNDIFTPTDIFFMTRES